MCTNGGGGGVEDVAWESERVWNLYCIHFRDPSFDGMVWPRCEPPFLKYLDITVNVTNNNVKKTWLNDIRRFWNLALPTVAKLATTSPSKAPQKCSKCNQEVIDGVATGCSLDKLSQKCSKCNQEGKDGVATGCS